MKRPISFLTVPSHVRYEKWASMLAKSFCETFKFDKNIYNIFFEELVEYYRENKEQVSEGFKNTCLQDFKVYLEKEYEKDKTNLKDYKTIIFYLSLITGDDDSTERSHIGDPRNMENTFFFTQANHDDYLCSPEFLEWVNTFIKAFQEELGVFWKR